jgi:hypothetical protein
VAARTIGSWKYFKNIHEIPHLDALSGNWSDMKQLALPGGIHIFRIISDDQKEFANYHAAIVIVFPCSSGREAIIYTPHGTHSASLQRLSRLKPPITPLALLHGLHEVTNPWYLGGKLNLGAHNAYKAIQLLNPGPSYWITTHDEVKKGAGFVSKVIDRKQWSFDDAVSGNAKPGINHSPDTFEGRRLINGQEVQFVALGSGDSLKLE